MYVLLSVVLAVFLQEGTSWSSGVSFSRNYRQANDEKHAPLTQKQKERIHSIAQELRGIVTGLASEEQKNQLSGELAALFAESGDLEAARDIAGSIKSDAERTEALASIARAQGINQDFAGALETVASIGTESRRAAVMLDVISEQAGAKDFSGALQNAGKLTGRPPTYTSALVKIAEARTKANQKTEALELLAKALESSSGVTGCSYEEIQGCRLSLLGQIASAQFHAGDAAAAQKTLELAEQGLAQLPQEERFASVAELVSAEQELGHPERVKDLLSTMPGMAGQLGEVLSAMQQASQAAEKGDLASVRTAVEAISDPQQRSFGELMMAEAYASAGDAKSALDTLRTLKPVSQRAQFAGGVAQGLAQKGKFAEADEALKIGMAAAETEENDSELEELLAAAVQIQAESGDADATRAKAALIKNREKRAQAVREAAQTLASKKKEQEVLKWSAAEESAFVKANLLLGAAEGIAAQEGADKQHQ
jgi:thioredoxin-like negative regulator of GroEL